MHKQFVALLAFLVSLPAAAAEVESAMLLYQAQEPGVGAYASRILVTEEHVRMDDGRDDGDYLIFNRGTRLISSVTHDDETVFEIPAREVGLEPPLPLELHTESVATQEMPQVAGKAPQHRQLFVNGALCYSVVAVPDLMDDTVTALRDFRQVLAGEHAKVLPRTPADMQDPCDMALNTFHAEWQLQFGLPIQEWDENGNRQMLMDYKQGLMLDEALFELPEGYRHYNTDDI